MPSTLFPRVRAPFSALSRPRLPVVGPAAAAVALAAMVSSTGGSTAAVTPVAAPAPTPLTTQATAPGLELAAYATAAKPAAHPAKASKPAAHPASFITSIDHQQVKKYSAGLKRLRTCESGGNYGAATGNGYYGAYQFDLSTWHSLGLSGYPNYASHQLQDAAVTRLHARRGSWHAWPVCSYRAGLA